jgi:hypothetical protein
MAVITVDTTILGLHREKVFAWLSDPAHHSALFDGAFDRVTSKGGGNFELSLRVPPKTRTIGCEWLGPDETHGGRRIEFRTTGKRTGGLLRYSLRTAKPKMGTMVTLHMDYSPGSGLGSFINSAGGLQDKLRRALTHMLDNLVRELPVD